MENLLISTPQHRPIEKSEKKPSDSIKKVNQLHSIGDELIYNSMGRYVVASIEQKTINGTPISFYKLEKYRPHFVKEPKNESSVWVPVLSANEQGLRDPITQKTSPQLVANIYALFSSKDFFFNLADNKKKAHQNLESCIKKEGATGIAKAISFLSLIKNRNPVFDSEMSRYLESLQKILFKELADFEQVEIRIIEEKFKKLIRTKLLADH